MKSSKPAIIVLALLSTLILFSLLSKGASSGGQVESVPTTVLRAPEATVYLTATSTKIIPTVIPAMPTSTTPSLIDVAESPVGIVDTAITPQPKFIDLIFPEPGLLLTISELTDRSESHGSHRPSICLAPTLDRVMERGDTFQTIESWLHRVTVAVNNKTTKSIIAYESFTHAYNVREYGTGQFLYTRPAGWPFTICFPFEPIPGINRAHLVIATTSGATLAYEWFFTIGE